MGKSANVSIPVQGMLEMRGQQFPFYLEHRSVDLGPAGEVQLYYMPVGKLRGKDPEQRISNFRSCIGFWYAVMQERGFGSDWNQQCNVVLATSYALVRRDKKQQSIYRDALLRSGGVHNERLTLSDSIRERIRLAVTSRDRDAIRQEMETALEAHQLSRADTLGVGAALDRWVSRGVQNFRTGGRNGLLAWLEEIKEWIRRYRKRSAPRVRLFLDCFAYEAKTSFYLCYANFWIGLLQWLEVNHNLDPVSKRFLRIWHNQNRPVEIPHGCTLSGIVYPTRAGRQLALPDDAGNRHVHELSWVTDHVGPEAIPDVFLGQVLALHPLSFILLDRPELCEQVGACIASPPYEEAMRSGNVDHFSEYWRMVEAIVTAAYLYQEARLRYESERRVKPLSAEKFSDEGRKLDPSCTPATLLRDYVDGLVQTCPCGGKYRYVATGLPTADANEVLIPVECDSCDLPSKITATQASLAAFLKPNDSE